LAASPYGEAVILKDFNRLNNMSEIQDNPTMSLRAQSSDDGLIRIDIIARKVPENLFGASFHLVSKDTVFQLERYERGNVFAVEPLLLVREKETEDYRIIVGTSLKRDDILQAKDGVLLSLFVKPLAKGSYSVSFENALLSTFNNGRQDMTNVEWNNQEFFVDIASFEDGKGENSTYIIDEHETGNDNNQELILGTEYSKNGSLQESINTEGKAMLLQNPDVLFEIYMFLTLSFFILSGFFILWFLASRNLLKPLLKRVLFWRDGNE
jgi:hypothetical protein